MVNGPWTRGSLHRNSKFVQEVYVKAYLRTASGSAKVVGVSVNTRKLSFPNTVWAFGSETSAERPPYVPNFQLTRGVGGQPEPP